MPFYGALLALFLALSPGSPSAAPKAPPDADSAVTYFAHHPSGAVFNTEQTPDGYLWFATISGLYRFDGFRFARFTPENTPALSHPRIHHLAVTTDGRLWVASGEPGASRGSWERGGPGLVVYEGGVFRRIQPHEGLPDEWVLSLASAPGNKLWIGTAKGLALWHDGKIQSFGAPEGSDQRVFHVRPGDRGSVWIGSSLGLSRFDETPGAAGTSTARFTLERPKVFPIWSSRAPSGTLWMTNLHDVFRLEPGAESWTHYSDAVGLTMQNVRAVAEDREGRLWLAGSGVAQVDLGTRKVSRAQVMGAPLDPNNSVVHSLFLDNEGSIWVGTREGGVFQAAPARVLNYGLREGMPDDVGFALLRRRDGSVLLSFGAGLVRVKHGALAVLPKDAQAPKLAVRSLTETPTGEVWMATGETSIYRYVRGSFAKVNVMRNGAIALADTVVADHRGGLWVAWKDGGLSYYEPSALAAGGALGEDRFFTEAAGVCPGRHLSGSIGKDGRVWFGNYDHGITEAAGGTMTCHREGGLPPGTVLGIFEDEDGAVFAGVHGAIGLYRLREGVFVRYNHGLDTSVFGIAKDHRGNLWFGSAAGALKVKRKDLDAADPADERAPIPWLRFTHADGLRSDESIGGTSPAAGFDDGERFWFPTLRGFSAVVDPAQRAPLPLSRPFVEQVHADLVRYATHRQAFVPAGRGNLTIDYTSPSFTLPNQLSFEYLLEGFDKEWVSAKGRRTAYYTNVPPGSYAFRVRVRRGDGAAAESAQPFKLTLQPFFYQRASFYGGLAVAVAALGVALHRGRVRQLETRHALVHQERTRLARELHDHLGQGFTAIGFALDALRSRLRGNDIAQIAEQARGLLEHCQTETRRLVWDLRSEAGRLGDVGVALRQVVERARVPGGPGVQFETDGRAEVSGLAEHELPLIAQEAITNALRHAHASSITVSLRHTAEGTTMTVTDDGVGFPPRAAGGATLRTGHFGLVGMEERARRLQARLHIHSAPGAGTEISVTVPSGGREVSTARTSYT